jgi:DNA modification methylase
MQFDELPISSPKRDHRLDSGWDGFFPYYAGYPESFARKILQGSGLKPGAVVLDPWNGSGTTTFAAAHLGFKAVGLDLNPVMVIVSRARTLPFSEIDALEPLENPIYPIHLVHGSRVARHLSSAPSSEASAKNWSAR